MAALRTVSVILALLFACSCGNDDPTSADECGPNACCVPPGTGAALESGETIVRAAFEATAATCQSCARIADETYVEDCAVLEVCARAADRLTADGATLSFEPPSCEPSSEARDECCARFESETDCPLSCSHLADALTECASVPVSVGAGSDPAVAAALDEAAPALIDFVGRHAALKGAALGLADIVEEESARGGAVCVASLGAKVVALAEVAVTTPAELDDANAAARAVLDAATAAP